MAAQSTTYRYLLADMGTITGTVNKKRASDCSNTLISLGSFLIIILMPPDP